MIKFNPQDQGYFRLNSPLPKATSKPLKGYFDPINSKDDNDFTLRNRGIDTIELNNQLDAARNDLGYAKELKDRINAQKLAVQKSIDYLNKDHNEKRNLLNSFLNDNKWLQGDLELQKLSNNFNTGEVNTVQKIHDMFAQLYPKMITTSYLNAAPKPLSATKEAQNYLIESIILLDNQLPRNNIDVIERDRLSRLGQPIPESLKLRIDNIIRLNQEITILKKRLSDSGYNITADYIAKYKAGRI